MTKHRKTAFMYKYAFWLFTILLCPALAMAEPRVVKTNSNMTHLPTLYIEYPMTLKKGETPTGVLTRHGLPMAQAAKAMHVLQRKYKVKQLRPGQEFILRYDDTHTLQTFSFFGPDDKHVIIRMNDNTYPITIKKRKLTTKQVAVKGTITDSLYGAAQDAHMPAALVPAFANLFAWELDFTRDIRPGDTFHLVYERIQDDDGNYLRSGHILGAELHLAKHKKTLDAYRVTRNGSTEYYSSTGYNKRRTLLRTPLEFTRISSHYNLKRLHPVLKYTRAHRGTDFAAPTGTPVKAAGDGVVERANWYGSYGKYIRIKHNNKFKTAYAHLHRFARGIKAGSSVKQGQVIGYVGNTGRSTGPHLHYEVHRYGEKVNPMAVKLPTGARMSQSEKAAFQKKVTSFHEMWNTL